MSAAMPEPGSSDVWDQRLQDAIAAADPLESPLIASLGSRSIIDNFVPADTLNPVRIRRPFLLALEAWQKARLTTDQRDRASWLDEREPVVLGWVHLYAEACRRLGATVEKDEATEGHGTSISWQERIADVLSRAPRGVSDLLPVIDPESVTNNIPGLKAHGKEILETWDKLLSGNTTGERGVARTAVGQALVMHALEGVLSQAATLQSPAQRARLNLLLVPLIRAMYADPARAYATYSAYFGTHKAIAKEAFHHLYRDDLGLLEDFQARGVARRNELLATLRDVALQQADQDVGDGSTPLPRELLEKANRIAHGIFSDELVTSPKPKMTRLTQLTCLIREIDTEGSSETASLRRTYQTALKGIHYRSAQFQPVAEPSPTSLEWKHLSTSKAPISTFLDCVDQYYEGGYEVAPLADLFAKGPTGAAALPVWISEGELTLLYLLDALAVHDLGSTRSEWLRGEATVQDIGLSRAQISHTTKEGDAPYLVTFGKSFEEFLSEKACLFKDSTPLPRMWSLMNFVERLLVHHRPDAFWTKEGDPHPIVALCSILCDELFQGESVTPEKLQSACEEMPPRLVAQALSFARLRSYRLEHFLRVGQPIPQTLFFCPINFGRRSEAVVPNAFLAGTFAGLEWPWLPTATVRHNHHLFTLLDALRPIVDFEVGRVFEKDQRTLVGRVKTEAEAAARMQAAEQREKEAWSRAKTYSTIGPAVDDLSRILREAQGHLLRIEAVSDSNWSGLFSKSLGEQLSDLFVDGSLLKIPNAVGTEPKEIEAQHEVGSVDDASKVLYQRLVYLARSVVGASSVANDASIETPLGDEGGWKVSAIPAWMFRGIPFLQALARAAFRNRENKQKQHELNLLLKLLTVDSLVVDRGVHVAQIAALLGMSANIKTVQARVRIKPSLRSGEKDSDSSEKREKAIEGLFNPKNADGVIDLANIVGADGPGASTSSLPSRAGIHGGLKPFEGLRALRILAQDVFRQRRVEAAAGDERVELVDWSVGYGESAIECVLWCRGRLTKDVKSGLWSHFSSGAIDYHDFRSNFSTLCRIVGGFPVFVRVSDLGEQPDWSTGSLGSPADLGLSAENPFVIAESGKTGVSLWGIRFGSARLGGGKTG